MDPSMSYDLRTQTRPPNTKIQQNFGNNFIAKKHKKIEIIKFNNKQ